MEMSLLKVGRIDEIASGTMRRVTLEDGTPVAVYRVGNEFFATSDLCTHGTASLTEGELSGETIECPFHGGAFSCRTGEAVEGPCTLPLECFKVAVHDSELFVGRG